MKRILAFVLAVCLVVLCGCQTVPSETTEPTTEPTTAPTTVPTEPPTEPTTEPTVYIGLTMDQPQEPVTTLAETFTLSGQCDPNESVTVNGVEAEQDGLGNFTCDYPLEPGINEITVTHKGETAAYRVDRRYCVQYYTPDESRSYGADATVFLRLAAREGSQITATFNGKEVEMSETVDQLGTGLLDGFVLYLGYAYMPSRPEADVNLGPVEYTVTCDGITETYSSGNLVCNAYVDVTWTDPEATPEGYRNVGSGHIVEIIDVSVETYDGQNTNDYSHPNFNYLPAGTVDYGKTGTIVSEDDCHYKLLRCGIRVTQRIKNTPYQYKTAVVDCYNGYLPNYNEINVASIAVEGHHTYLTLDCLWKAPFFFDFEEQVYTNAHWRDHTVEVFDAGYVDITFCYATSVTGDITVPEDNPLFSRAELIQNVSDYTLRLYLKTEGGLYGWDAYYNEDDQLVFQFLNPVTVTEADNAYGADLTGVVVMLDVGHGKGDTGAAGVDTRGWTWVESERNLAQALAIKAELESIGATVLMNRYSQDEMTTQRERIQYLKEQAPDYCLCIHHNSVSANPNRTGFEAFYFTTYTQPAAKHILRTTEETDLYWNSLLAWHYYYVARQTICPIVLVECGFMSNAHDMIGISDQSVVEAKAVAMTQGIVDYFLELTEKVSQ